MLQLQFSLKNNPVVSTHSHTNTKPPTFCHCNFCVIFSVLYKASCRNDATGLFFRSYSYSHFFVRCVLYIQQHLVVCENRKCDNSNQQNRNCTGHIELKLLKAVTVLQQWIIFIHSFIAFTSCFFCLNLMSVLSTSRSLDKSRQQVQVHCYCIVDHRRYYQRDLLLNFEKSHSEMCCLLNDNTNKFNKSLAYYGSVEKPLNRREIQSHRNNIHVYGSKWSAF